MPSLIPHRSLDKVQFEKLFKTHFEHLCHFAQQYVSDADAAQDICQQVFIALWQKREDIDPKLAVKSYLFTAVKMPSDGSAFFYTRGGERDQNLIIIDDALIYNPSHLFGF